MQRDENGKFQGLENGGRYMLTVKEDAETAAASAAAAKEVAARNKARRELENKQVSLAKSKVTTCLDLPLQGLLNLVLSDLWVLCCRWMTSRRSSKISRRKTARGMGARNSGPSKKPAT